MAADDLSLLLRLRGDASSVKQASAEARQAINQLKQTFGPELTQAAGVSQKAFESIGNSVENLVRQQLPVLGNVAVSVTNGLKGITEESRKGAPSVDNLAKSITNISRESKRSIGEITSFLTKFVQIEGQAKRDAAAIEFFGATLGARLIPQLEKAGTQLSAISTEAAATGTSLSSLAGPIGIVVIATAALAAGVGLAAKELFDLAKQAADFQGKMFDLSQQTGVAVETLSALEVVAKTTGGSIEQIAASLGIFQKNLEEAQDATSRSADTFRRLRVDTSDTETALRETMAALAEMPEGFEQTALALQLFGRGGKTLLAILKETNGDLDGTIERLRELGILVTGESARAADEFNDQLAIVNFQIRALSAELAREALPAILDIVKQVSVFIRENKQLIRDLSVLVGLVARVAAAIIEFNVEMRKPAIRGFTLAVEALATAYERIRDAVAFITGHPIAPPTTQQAVSTTITTARAAAGQRRSAGEVFGTKELQAQAQAQDELAGIQQAAVDEARRLADQRIADAERAFRAGEITRKQELASVLKGLEERRDADLESLRQERERVVTRAILARDDLKRRTELENQIFALDQRAETVRANFEKQAADKRLAARLEERDELQRHERAKLDILISAGEARIRILEQQAQSGTKTANEAADQIEEIENAIINARRGVLEKEFKQSGIAEGLVIKDALTKLGQEEQELRQKQAERRQKLLDQEGKRDREILTANLEALLEIERINGEARIATLESLAAARIKTEEDAAKEILQIRLELLDDEIRATKAQLEAAEGIGDPADRIKAVTEANNRLRVLAAQRAAIEQQGERDVEIGRQTDLENERRYADELREIRERIVRTQHEAARNVLRLMVLNFASRRDILKKELEIELAEAGTRHQAIRDSIREDQRGNDERIRLLEGFIETLKAAGSQTSAEYEKAVADLRAANERKAELHREEEAELERSETEKAEIQRRNRLEAREADPIGRLELDVDNLQEFASVIEDSIVPLGEILTRTFLQVADAIGQTVANWVLLGETGPAVMRKILAQALASIAAEAAVNAIKELALGFATLFFNPAESAAHFKAAALWAAVGGVAAVAGRGVAGNLFKPTAGGGAVGAGGGGRNELNPITLQRNAGPGAPQQFAPQIQPQRVQVMVTVNEGRFADAIKTTVIDDVNNRGPIGEIIANDGNLNRG